MIKMLKIMIIDMKMVKKMTIKTMSIKDTKYNTNSDHKILNKIKISILKIVKILKIMIIKIKKIIIYNDKDNKNHDC